MPPNVTEASVRRRETRKAPGASKAGRPKAPGASKAGRPTGRRNFKGKSDTASSSRMCELENIHTRLAVCEIMTNGQKRISDLLAKFDEQRKSRLDVSSDSVEEEPEIQVVSAEEGSVKKYEVGDVGKNCHCVLCGKDGHWDSICPYLKQIPRVVERLPPQYSMVCKKCVKVADKLSCPHKDDEDWERYALMKHCMNCFKWGHHWTKRCPIPYRVSKPKRKINKALVS